MNRRRECYRKYRMLFSIACAVLPALAPADPVKEGVVPETGLRYWEWQSQGVLFRLTQRLPDQTRAFFMARDFDAGNANIVATQCVFQTMFRNTGGKGSGAVEINLDEWVVEANDTQSSLVTREQWKQKWTSRGVSAGAMIAFEWSLLPTTQVYPPDDYHWGMTSYGLAPCSRLALHFSSRRNGHHLYSSFRRVTYTL